MSESEIQKAILAYLLSHPRVMDAWRNNTGAVKRPGRYIRFSRPGISDILGYFDKGGKIIAIEVKAPGKKPTQAQIAFVDMVDAAGGLGMFAESVQEVEDAMKRLGYL